MEWVPAVPSSCTIQAVRSSLFRVFGHPPFGFVKEKMTFLEDVRHVSRESGAWESQEVHPD